MKIQKKFQSDFRLILLILFKIYPYMSFELFPSLYKKSPKSPKSPKTPNRKKINPTSSIVYGKENSKFDPNLIQTPQKLSSPRMVPLKRVPKTPQAKSTESLLENNSDIKVFLRVRPLLKNEIHADFDITDNIVTARPSQKQVPSNLYTEKTFQFTHIFEEQSTQNDLFENISLPMLSRFLKGQDTLLLSYGATSAGKTFTIQGTDSDPGLLPRMISTLLHLAPTSGVESELDVSCVEVYNERVHDLLGDTSKNLRIGKDGFGNTTVKEMTEIQLTNIDDMKRVLKDIEIARKRSSTSYNAESSRSHCIFMLKLITIPLTSSGARTTDLRKIKCTRMTIVDLAGSERVSITNQDKKIISEASSINKSMFILGCCIRKLRQVASGDNTQIPFRESKLTELLRDYFETSDRTVTVGIIINISPSVQQFEDTLFSLQFAAEVIHCSTKGSNDFSQDEHQIPLANEDTIDYEEEEERIKRNNQMLEDIRYEMNEQITKIQKDYQNQLERIKIQSAQPYTSKLQKALAERMASVNRNRELEECKKELERERNHSALLRQQIEDVQLQIDEASVKLQDMRDQNENLQVNIEKIIDMTKKLHQKQVNTEKDLEEKIHDLEKKLQGYID